MTTFDLDHQTDVRQVATNGIAAPEDSLFDDATLPQQALLRQLSKHDGHPSWHHRHSLTN
jgi:hypothetical protein